jgi:hypothetical protein
VLEYCKEHTVGLLRLRGGRFYSIPALAAIPLGEHQQAFVVDPFAPLPNGLTVNGIGADFARSCADFAQWSDQPGLADLGSRI